MPDPSDGPPPPARLLRPLLLVAGAVFVSTLAQTVTLGSLPLRTLLKDTLHISPTQMALFFSIVNLAWYLKPIAGLCSDAFPLLGTRRRHYLIFGCALGAAGWLLLGLVPHRYTALLAAAILVNGFLVIISTAAGGLLVEEGSRLRATGTFSSARSITLNLAVVLAGPIGGWLALQPFFWTSVVGAVLLLAYVPMVFFFLHEAPTARPRAGVFVNAFRQLKQALASGPLWAAAGLLMLVHLSPGFQTPLYYHMTNDLHFTPRFIGWTDSIAGVAGVLASLLYLIFCRRFTLRTTYVITLIAAAAGALPFLALKGRVSALIISFGYQFGLTLADVASLDLAARASPRGCEAMGYALMISFWNLGIAFSDILGSWMYDQKHVSFTALIYLNAGSTLLVLLPFPFCPAGWSPRAKETPSLDFP